MHSVIMWRDGVKLQKRILNRPISKNSDVFLFHITNSKHSDMYLDQKVFRIMKTVQLRVPMPLNLNLQFVPLRFFVLFIIIYYLWFNTVELFMCWVVLMINLLIDWSL